MVQYIPTMYARGLLTFKGVYHITCGPCIQDTASEDDTVPPRQLLVFINPAGGPGKAVREFEQHVQPLFELAEIQYKTIITGESMMS